MTRASEQQSEADIPLIEAKLASPRVRAGVLARRRLFTALDRFANTELTLVTAPPGSGKTVLIVSWLSAQRQLATAWVTLDADDDNPLRLWTYIAQAVERIQRGLGQAALATLRTPRAPTQRAVDDLLNSLAKSDVKVALILDDLHHVHDQDALRLLGYAIEHLPANVRVLATSRTDPGIGIARLRARGALGEIRARDLAFTVEETSALLVEQAGIDLQPTDVESLVARTEGWPAGIGLAGLWLSESDSPASEIEEFSGTRRDVADYLTSEVLDAADDATGNFLLKTSVLGRFCADLCDAVLGTDDSATRLAALERSNLFLVRLDANGAWYRYHHLFRELLRAELASTSDEPINELHVRAAEWFRAHGHLDEALTQVAATGDFHALAELIAAEHRALVSSGNVDVLLRWLQRLPVEELQARPVLAAVGALTVEMLAQPSAESNRFAATAAAGMQNVPQEVRDYIETILAVTRAAMPDEGLSASLELAGRAVELARTRVGDMAVVALAVRSYGLYLAGDKLGARTCADEALARPDAPQRPHGLIYAHAVHALVDEDSGKRAASESEARHAVALARVLGLLGAWSAGIAHHALGYVLLHRGRPAEAERELERAEQLRRAPSPRLDHAHSLIVLAEARLARGKLTLAEAELAAAREQLAAFTDVGQLTKLLAGAEQQLATELAASPHVVEPPSPAELAVLRLLASELSQREIGGQLFLTVNTVKTHTLNLYRKLGVNSRDAAVRQARAVGLIESGESPG